MMPETCSANPLTNSGLLVAIKPSSNAEKIS
jgi:hypothetical protein